MSRPTIVLVHGAFGDASSWRGVFDLLDGGEYDVLAAALALRGVASDAAYLGAVIDQPRRPRRARRPLLRRHGDHRAGASDKVAALVYVDAFIPDAGESITDLQTRFPSLGLGDFLRPRPLPDGTVELTVDPDRFQDVFCADVADDLATFMAHAQRPLAANVFDESPVAAAWRTKPSWADRRNPRPPDRTGAPPLLLQPRRLHRHRDRRRLALRTRLQPRHRRRRHPHRHHLDHRTPRRMTPARLPEPRLTPVYRLDAALGEPLDLGDFNVAAGASPFATYACVDTWLTDFRADLPKIDVPVLVVHGTDDDLPVDATAARLPALIADCTLVRVEGGPHNIAWTHPDEVNNALLEFIAPKVPVTGVNGGPAHAPAPSSHSELHSLGRDRALALDVDTPAASARRPRQVPVAAAERASSWPARGSCGRASRRPAPRRRGRSPSAGTSRARPAAKPPNTATMIRAAPVIRRAVERDAVRDRRPRCRPSASNRSRIRESRNTW